MTHRTRIPRLAIVTSDYHYWSDGRVWTTSAFMRFVPELTAIAERIEVLAPVHVAADADDVGFTIESSAITYRSLPPSRTIEQWVRKLPTDGATIAHRVYTSVREADLVWINGPHPLQPFAAAICRATAVPYLLWLRGDILAGVRAKYIERSRRDRMAARTAHYLDRMIGLAARDAVVFYTGGGLARYSPTARYSQPVMTSLVAPAQLASAARASAHVPLRLLWAGQLRPVKGLLHLLTAVRRMVDAGAAVQLTLVGDGEQRPALEAELARLDLGGIVELAGYVAPGAALDRYFDEADVFVLPSLSEGVPKVLLEAMARALPVVTSRTGGIPDIVHNEISGLLVPPANVAALQDAVVRLAQDDDLRRRLGEGALSFAREHTAQREVERIDEGLRRAFPSIWTAGRRGG